MTRRFLVLLLIASFCFSIFIIGVSAAGGEATASLTWRTPSNFGSPLSVSESSPSSTGSWPSGDDNSKASVRSVSLSTPSAGTLIVSVSPAPPSPDSIPSDVLYSSGTITFSPSSASSVTLSWSGFNPQNFNVSPPGPTLKIVSWTASSGSGGSGGPGGSGSNDSSGNSILGPSQGGMDIWNSDGSINGDQRNDITGNSSQWNIHDTYIGQLDYFIQGDEATYETSVWISKMLANLSYTTWSWKYDESTGNFLYVRPNPGSWLDNMWQMNIYLYYNLANQKGWFGHINSEFATLNNRVLQILSVLANDEDVKIKDATTDHRNWITDFFEGKKSGKPTTSDNDAVNDSMNTVKDQFQSSYTVGDIGSIFSGNSYDNNIWYTFWSQSVFNDVNGFSRGGFGGGKAPARAPVASHPSWSSQYSYDDDSIPDMSGFGGGLSD